jgi:hypothetical protein
MGFGVYGQERMKLNIKLKNENKIFWSLKDKYFRLMNVNYGNINDAKILEQGLVNYHFISETQYNLLFSNLEINYNSKTKVIKDIIQKIFDKIHIPIKIEDTIKLDYGHKNMFIPKYKNILSFINHLAKYAINYYKKGGFQFFENKDDVYFTSLSYLYNKYNENNKIIISSDNQDLNMVNIRWTPVFQYQWPYFGHNQEIVGLDYRVGKTISTEKNIKDNTINIKENNKIKKSIKDNIINISKTIQVFENGNKKSIKFLTPYNSLNSIKGFNDTLFYYKMFDNFLEVDFTINYNMLNKNIEFIKIGEFINIEFYIKDNNTNTYIKVEERSGAYFIHSLQIKFENRDQNIQASFLLKLARFGVNKLIDNLVKV